MAAREMEVSTEIPLANPMISRARPNPAFPTTYPNRKKRMIPRIVSMLGVNTPENVPNVAVARLSPSLSRPTLVFIRVSALLMKRYEK